MENIVYTTPKNVTIEISWEAYKEEIERRAKERQEKKATAALSSSC